MVAPLIALGMLGAGGAALASPHVRNYAAKVKGRYNQQLMQGQGAGAMGQPFAPAQNNAQQIGYNLFGGGLADPDTFMGEQYTSQRAYDDNVAAMARQQVSSGPAYQNANLAREQWDYAVTADTINRQGISTIAQATGMPSVYAGVPQLELAWVNSKAGASFQQLNRTTSEILEDDVRTSNALGTLVDNQSSGDNQKALEQAWQNDPTYSSFNMPTGSDGLTDWAQVSTMLGPQPVDPIFSVKDTDLRGYFSDHSNLQAASSAIADSIQFVRDSVQGGRVLGSAEIEALKTRMETTVIPALGVLENTGVIEQGTAERYAKRLSLAGKEGRTVERLTAIETEINRVLADTSKFIEGATTPQQRAQMGWGSVNNGLPPNTVAGVSP